MTSDKPKRRPRRVGRPDRAIATVRALKGVDTTKCDARQVLREVALDRSQPGSARVAAARALGELDAIEAAALASMQARTEAAQDGRDDSDEGEHAQERDAVLADALARLQRH